MKEDLQSAPGWIAEGILPSLAPPVAEQPPAELGVLPAVAPSAADLQQVLPEQTKIPGPPPAKVDQVKKNFFQDIPFISNLISLL